MAAETPRSEYLDDLMQTGYDLLDDRNTVVACEQWLEVWGALKQRFTPEMMAIRDAERVFTGLQSLHNWCQDFEMHLANAGRTDASFHDRRVEYCREFCELFPNSEPLIIQNMRSAAAVSLFALGRVAEGEQEFEAVVDEHLEYGWG